MRDLDILESWKEIADYLKKSERTCRRWEQEFELPLHRMDGSPKARVFAYKYELDKWIQEMLHTADDSEKRRISFKSLSKSITVMILFFAVCLIGVILWRFILRTEEISPVPTGKPSLAIMYFENNSGEENLDNWRSGLCEMLITDINQSKFINVISGDRIYSILEEFDLLEKEKYSTEELMRVARQAGVNHIMRGSYITAGNKFILNVSVLKAESGEVISSIEEEGIGEGSITGSVDKITRELKSVLNISPEQIASDLDEEIGKVTTNSTEALRYFIQGRRHYLRSEHNKSINFMEKAVEIDPEFSMAYILLSNSWGNLGFYEKRLFFAKKAFEFKERLTEREFYRIQSYYYRRQQLHEKAIESFETLIRLYPDESMANNSLGLSYRDTGQLEKAIERFKYLIDKKEQRTNPYTNLASVYRRLGEYDKAREVLQYYLNNIRDDSGVRRGIARAYISEGNLEKALLVLEETLSLYPDDFNSYRIKGQTYQFRNEIGKAEECFQKLIELNEPRQLSLKDDGFRGFAYLRLQEGKYKEAKDWITRGLDVVKTADEFGWGAYSYVFLAYLNLKLSEFEDVLAKSEKALDITTERNDKTRQLLALTYRGLGYLKSNSETEARQTADELKALAEGELPEANMRYYFLLEGMIDSKRGNAQGALAKFKKAKSLLNHQSLPYQDEHALFYESLASAYYKSGNLEQARKEYEEIILLTTGRLLFGDIYAKSFYMLGKIHEEQGNTTKAIKHYEKFLDLWNNADTGMAEVEDARERLAELQKSP